MEDLDMDDLIMELSLLRREISDLQDETVRDPKYFYNKIFFIN